VATATKPGAQVGGAGEHVAEMLVPHEFVSVLLDQSFHFVESIAEALEHRSHVGTLLHRYHTVVILLVDPYQEVLLVVVPDTASVGPISGHAGAEKQRANGFVEEEAVSDELILILFRATVESDVPLRKLPKKLWPIWRGL
jgi:hypothetical protein